MPSIRIRPEVGVSRPAISRSNVDLPHPDGPTTVRTSLCPISRDTSSSARWPPANCLDTFSRRITGMGKQNTRSQKSKGEKQKKICCRGGHYDRPYSANLGKTGAHRIVE